MSPDPMPAPALEVRPARQEDREAVLAFCAHTWPGGDYIPYLWDEWLADTGGALLVAVADDHPVGLVHVRMMSSEEGWIEGVRVDPAAQRQGIGRVLVSRALVAARERGATVARFLTGRDNLPSQALFARFGFTRVAEIVRYRAPALEGDPQTLAEGADSTNDGMATSGSVRSLDSRKERDDEAMPHDAILTLPGEEQFERIWAWLVQSNLAPLTGGLEFDGWSARALAEPFLRDELAAGRVLLLEEWDTILALAVTQAMSGTAGEASSLDARYIDGLSDGIGRLALALRDEARERGLSQVTLWLPDLLILRDAMDGAGYTSEDGVMWIYARSL